MPVRKDAGPNSGFFSLKRRKSPDDSDASNDARRRITIACLRCRHRKIRCDGSDPCNKCNSAGAECEYYAVTKEENQAAREKKALAKATRAKNIKMPNSQVQDNANKDAQKTGTAKKRGPRARRAASSPPDSSVTPEPPQERQDEHRHSNIEFEQEMHKRPRLHLEPAYTMSESRAGTALHTVPEAYVEDDTQSASDSADTYFGYLSSSTVSLQSSLYEPVYAPQEPIYAPQEPVQYLQNVQNYHVSPAAMEPSYYPSYTILPPDTKLHEQMPALSYPMDSPQPSGLCLYLDEAAYANTYTPYASASNPVTPSLPQSYEFSQPSPPLYHGPINWSSRPLAPFQASTNLHHNHQQEQQHQQQQQQQQSHQQAQFYQRARSYSDLPMYTQTVSLDQVCSAGV